MYLFINGCLCQKESSISLQLQRFTLKASCDNSNHTETSAYVKRPIAGWKITHLAFEMHKIWDILLSEFQEHKGTANWQLVIKCG